MRPLTILIYDTIQPMSIIYFIRHGETNYNLQKLCNSSGKEVFLTPLGITQAQEAAKSLSSISFDQIIISPTHRTRETFSYLNISSPLPKEDTRVSELKTGMEGLPIKTYLDAISDPVRGKTPTGESFEEVYVRFTNFLEEFKNQDQKILVVTHSIILKAATIYMNKLSIDSVDKVSLPGNGEILRIKI